MDRFLRTEKNEHPPPPTGHDFSRSPQILVEKQENISGSTAGAGSGEFHHYRIQRRRERARIYHIEKEAKLKQIQEEFEDMKAKRMQETEEKTKKKAEKRIKKKLSAKTKKLKKQQETIGRSLNKFPNDGSFFEKFLQKQKETTTGDVDNNEKIE